MATVTSLPRPLPSVFDPALPPPLRRDSLLSALPPVLRDRLAQGRTESRPRFAEDGFDGMAERWSPPAGVTPAEAALAQRAHDELCASVLAPVDGDHLLARILSLLSHFPAKGLSPEVERLVALDWAEDLGEYPAWTVDAAARLWRRSRKWRPSIAEMRALCEELCAPERALAARLRALAAAGRDERDGAAPAGGVRAPGAGTLRRMG
ncbi:hypothetical protein [Azospirillum picis]|uniref:Uncharacterized protein n=1 Tax=Azospirillum picis TaxID=488438 RepID=A0ABU0MNK6_9PROT|nr:hypothetical protein [Azospirillum picis]MBP2301762.1 hypothetical protein [Azospirillum picis]MDQ0535063.1 hypothetical protein [Azospirillum picis]